ncbi:hypothetical protein MPSEU_000545800 [Mayamaea pseudoterrestris]|nr:hypothetical protein MPSEU_000545800 [Mayamaea pseudoterrestris]
MKVYSNLCRAFCSAPNLNCFTVGLEKLGAFPTISLLLEPLLQIKKVCISVDDCESVSYVENNEKRKRLRVALADKHMIDSVDIVYNCYSMDWIDPICHGLSGLPQLKHLQLINNGECMAGRSGIVEVHAASVATMIKFAQSLDWRFPWFSTKKAGTLMGQAIANASHVEIVVAQENAQP